MKTFKSLVDLMEYFNTEKKCINYFKSVVYKDGIYCPKCGSRSKIYEMKDGKTFKCGHCDRKFSIKTGTIFENSNISLRKWFIAIYLVGCSSKGISSVQLAKHLGVTQKTAWFMAHRIREVKTSCFFKAKGTVEVDETYIGGKEKNKHANKRTPGTQGRSVETKSPVIGIMERNGKIVAYHVDRVNTAVLNKVIYNKVNIGSKVYTDDFKVYCSLNSFYQHEKVNHRLGEYVRDDIHTNTIEGFWSILKRGVIGVYHWWSKKHLQRYLDEFTFRYNYRDCSLVTCLNDVLILAAGKRLTYKGLTV